MKASSSERMFVPPLLCCARTIGGIDSFAAKTSWGVGEGWSATRGVRDVDRERAEILDAITQLWCAVFGPVQLRLAR